MPGRVIGAIHEPTHRTEAVRGGGTDEMQARYRGLVVRRELRRPLDQADLVQEPLVQEAEPAHIDLVPGREDDVVAPQQMPLATGIYQIEHYLAVARLGPLN